MGRRLTSRPRRIPRGPVLVGPLSLAVLFATAGCTDAPSADDNTPRVTATVTASSADATDNEDDSEEHAVLAAYEGYWRAILAANDPPDQFHPDLARYATGEAFEAVFEAAQANRVGGRALRLPENSITEHRTDVVSITEDEATLRDCMVDDGMVVDLDSGEVIDDTVMTHLASVTLVREESTWKVATTSLDESWEGVAGCALQ